MTDEDWHDYVQDRINEERDQRIDALEGDELYKALLSTIFNAQTLSDAFDAVWDEKRVRRYLKEICFDTNSVCPCPLLDGKDDPK